MPDFVGKWIYGNKQLTIAQKNQAYTASFGGANIGLKFGSNLIFARFNEGEATQDAGVGVYIPVEGGPSNQAFWASRSSVSGISAGGGIAIEHEQAAGFNGLYDVTYFVDQGVEVSFKVTINEKECGNIYYLTWHKNEQKVFHGLGLLLEDSLAFAWGSLNNTYDLIVLTFSNTSQINMREIMWDNSINSYTLSKQF